MGRVSAVLGSALFFVIAPVTVGALVPWWISRWRVQASVWPPAQFIGELLVIGGALVLLDSFARFALQGLGTPAPVFPTRHLVVTGLYRYVRNPMYFAILATIAGQALIFGNSGLLAYGVLVSLAFHLFVIVYEEPKLRSAFGPEYERFCAGVPRWIPRLTPWRG